MAWTFNGVRIFPDNRSDDNRQIIARLQPIGAGTTLQFFGYEDPVVKLSGVIVGNTDKEALRDLMSTGLTYNLVNDVTTIGTYALNSITFEDTLSVSQTIRQDLDCTAPVYKFTMELYEDA